MNSDYRTLWQQGEIDGEVSAVRDAEHVVRVTATAAQSPVFATLSLVARIFARHFRSQYEQQFATLRAGEVVQTTFCEYEIEKGGSK